MKTNKILLVRPSHNPTSLNLEDITGQLPFLKKKAFMVPLDLATVAALTPEDVEVDLWDERLQGELDDATGLKNDYDLVGVTGYGAHFRRVRELGQLFRRRGILVAVGGPGVSAAPERYRDHFDILFLGEAEYIWQQFLSDWRANVHRTEYRQVTKVPMEHSPVPRWGNLTGELQHYMVGGVQTTRGCPFDCEFCDVIYIFGRQPRHKSIDQVLEEVSEMERLGMPHVFFCDDNFYGNPKYYKALLRELIALNRSFLRPVSFNTQVDLRIAKDDEMLALLADANFSSILIGIESPNMDSLIETNARKNLKADILDDVEKIQSHGIEVVGSMIVGFDHDDHTIFQRHFDFVKEACIPIPNLNVLRAMTGTKLWVRMLHEGRVMSLGGGNGCAEIPEDDIPFTNITPKLMTREELLTGFRDLLHRVRDWSNFEARVRGMISRVRRQPRVKQTMPRVTLRQRIGFLRFILFSMDRDARRVTIRLLFHARRKAPFMIPRVVKMTLQNHLWRAYLPFLREAIEEQLHLESRTGMRLQPRHPVFFVPEAFKKPYKAVFPELHDRVYQGLTDKTRTPDTLVEVFYDFLTRWGPSFQQFEEHHWTFLHEICDRSVAKENDSLQETIPLPVLDGAGRTGDASGKKTPHRLADDVLRSVEQEMRGFRPPSQADVREAIFD